jgi:hypothetical protein
MRTIIGMVAGLDARAKTLTVVSTRRADGRTRTRMSTVPWSGATDFRRKGLRNARSTPERIKLGMNVVITLDGGSRAATVWHPLVSGVLQLSAAECKNLGGTVSSDSDCPSINGTRRRCTTGGGTLCIDELSPNPR